MVERGIRAQAVVLTSIILFGFVVATAGVLQVYMVPAMNKEVEFDHNLAVQADLTELDEAVARAALAGTVGSVNVEPAPHYPMRFLLVNPPDASGSLRTAPLGSVSLDNVALSDERGVYYTGTLGPFETNQLRYTPQYREYAGAPETVYENRVVYNHFPGGEQLPVDDRSFVSGSRLTLVTITGDINVAGGSTYAINVVPVSTTVQSAYLTNSVDGPVTVSVPTTLSAATWGDILEPELVANGGHVLSHSVTGGVLTVTLEEDIEYEVRLASVGLGAVDPDTPVPGADTFALAQEAGHRIVMVEGTADAVPAGGTQKMVVEVRDRFNNPVKGAPVKSSDLVAVGSITPVKKSKTDPTVAITDESGRAEFIYTAPVDQRVDTGSVTFLIETNVEILTVDPLLVRSGESVAVSGTATGGADLVSVVLELVGDDGTAYVPDTIPQAQLTGDSYAGSLLVDGTVPDGVYDVRAVATDTSNNEATTVEVGVVTVDSTAPSLAVDSVVTDRDPQDALSGTVVTAAVTVDDPNGVDSVTVELLDSTGSVVETVTVAGAPTSVDVTVPATATAGAYDVRVTATDAAGNTASLTETSAFTVTTSMASAVSLDSATTKSDDTSAAKVTVTNDATTDVVVTDIMVKKPTGTKADVLLEYDAGSGAWNHEVFIDTTSDGHYDPGYSSYKLNSKVELTQQATIGGSQSADIYLYRFYDVQCSRVLGWLYCDHVAVDLTGADLEVTLYFSDGSTLEVESVVS